MNITYKSLIILAVLAVGGVLGASAISAFAQTGQWTAPECPPPGCNIDAPINVGTSEQAKTGLLALRSFLFNPSAVVGSVTPGSILTAMDSDGTVGWATPEEVATGDTCTLISTTPYAVPFSNDKFKAVNVPEICKNGLCTLYLAQYQGDWNVPGTVVEKVRATSMIQMTDSAKASKGAAANWWSKTGSSADGTDCSLGRNGTLDGCDILINTGDGIKLFDDSSSQEISDVQWSLFDESNSRSSKIWACK